MLPFRTPEFEAFTVHLPLSRTGIAAKPAPSPARGARRNLRFAAALWLLPAVLWAGAPAGEKFPEPSAEVFRGPPADYEELLVPRSNADEGRLRTLSVEERTGDARTNELVRVPVFFAEGECRSIDELVIVPADGTDARPVVIQADDVRHAPDGGISRAHLWFATDLEPGEKRTFHLMARRAKQPASVTDAMVSERTATGLRMATDAGEVEFDASGALRAVRSGTNTWRFAEAGAFPRVQIRYPAARGAPAGITDFDQGSASRSVAWAPGPLFTKVRLRIEGGGGAALEQVYRVPRHGRELVLTSKLFTGARVDGAVRENRLLVGRLEAGAGTPEVVTIPAGVRAALRSEHAYDVTSVRAPRAGALLAVPLVIGGANGRWQLGKEGQLTLFGLRGLKHGNEGEPDTLRAFWTEVRLVPAAATDERALWRVYRRHVQPLVAVVDEVGVTVDDLHRALSGVIREMKPVGWRQEAGRARVLGGPEQAAKVFARNPAPQEADAARLVRGARNATAKLTNNGARKLREDEKGRAYGGLDPYHITYTQSAAAALAELGEAPPLVAAAGLAMARGVREFGGRVDAYGSPYIDCFNRTLNMQMGPVLFGLTAGSAAGDDALARFYRDLVTAPAVQAVFGRGQRPYTSAPAKSRDQSDYLYQAICDFWLRATELLGGEELHEHPLAYSRYTDCIDVLADRYHGVASRDDAGATGRARANFFRGQTHTHRWLGWSCAPYIRLLEDPEEQAAIGLTEAIRHTQAQKGRWKNWPDLTFYILADLLVRESLARYSPPILPAAPDQVTVQRKGEAAVLSWARVPGAAEYRVYRAPRDGGPFRWLNSPHADDPAPKLVEPRYVDEDAPAEVAYVVNAVDDAGRESRWPESLSR